jgi:hypothetical protein
MNKKIIARKNHKLYGCKDSNSQPHPYKYSPQPPNLTLNCIYIGFWFPIYYTKPSIN